MTLLFSNKLGFARLEKAGDISIISALLPPDYFIVVQGLAQYCKGKRRANLVFQHIGHLSVVLVQVDMMQ